MLLKLFKVFLIPVNVLKAIFLIVLSFLLIEVEPLFIYISFSILFLSPVFKNLPRSLNNIFLILITSYLAFYFQFELHPESAISFFLILTAFKFTQIQERRDFEFLLHCLFIVIGGGALFNKEIYFIIFSFMSIPFLFFLFQLKDYRAHDGLNKDNLINILKIFFMASPLIASLFIFFPRYRYFFPSLGSDNTGKIGYTQTLENNSISSLRLNGVAALRVFTDKELATSDLYWRGRVFTKTDGFNWKYDRTIRSRKISEPSGKGFFKAIYQPLQNFHGDLIVKDWPTRLIGEDFIAKYNTSFQTYSTYFKNNKKQYTAWSGESFTPLEHTKKYLQLPLLDKDLEESLPPIIEQSFENIVLSLKRWIDQEGFVYSLSPGKMKDLQDFIENKKGYCTHYAALLALYLRMHQIPSRIVSGFQGGDYNNLGKYYLIRSNDAHTWVEAFVDKSWRRIDPTSWVAPDRILVGGQKYLSPYPFANSLKSLLGFEFKSSRLLANYYNFQKYIDYINSQVNRFFNNFNLEAQKMLAEKLNLNLRLFFSLVLILPIFFVLLYFLILNLNLRRINKWEKVHRLMNKVLAKNGFHWKSNEGIEVLLSRLNGHPKESVIKKSLDLYISLRYQSLESDSSFKKLKSLLRQI